MRCFRRSWPITALQRTSKDLAWQIMHPSMHNRLQLVRTVCLQSEKSSELRTHLSCDVACSCDVCACVRHRDEHVPLPGFLTPCLILSLWDRCPGTCTSVNTLPRCRSRTPREATHWPASSFSTSCMQILNPYCSSSVSSIPTANTYFPYCGTPQTCDLSYTPLVIWK